MGSEGLERLAQGVADGEEIDWDRLETPTEEEFKVIKALRGIAGIRDFYQTLNPDSPRLSRWAHLEIRERVAEGSYGEVYKAYDPQLDHHVALKLLKGEEADSPADGASAVQEGRLMAQVRHPNVVIVHGARRVQGRTGIWMEFVEGYPLSEIVKSQGSFAADEAVVIGIRLCGALAGVHARGILHRDVKAQNVMRETGGRIVLMDFGIGRQAESDGEGEAGENLAGTPLYLAPEVLRGENASIQSDIYSLGVLLYYLVTGRFPVLGTSLEELREAHREKRRTPLRDARGDLPARFVATVEKALSADSADRFQSCGQLEHALQASGRSESPRRLSRRKWLLAAAALAAILSVGEWTVRPHSWPTDGELLAQVDRLVNQGRFADARSKLKSLADEYPRRPGLLTRIGFLQYILGNMYEAQETLEQAYSMRDSLTGRIKWITKGHYNFILGDFKTALEDYKTAAQTTSFTMSIMAFFEYPDTSALRYAAQTEGYRGNLEQAIDIARDALAKNPNDSSTAGLLVKLLLENGDSKGALLAFTTYNPPDHQDLTMGMKSILEGNLNSAADSFAKATKILGGAQQNFAKRQLALADILQGEIPRAFKRLSQDIKDDYENDNRYYLLERVLWSAWLAFILGDEREAVRLLEEDRKLDDIPIRLKNLMESAVLLHYMKEYSSFDRVVDRMEQINTKYPSDSDYNQRIFAQLKTIQRLRENLCEVELLRPELERSKEVGFMWLAAQAFKQAGDIAESVTARKAHFTTAGNLYTEIISRKGLFLYRNFPGLWVLAHLELARCQAALDQTQMALDHYRTFLAHWEEADIAIVDEALKERREIEKRPSQ